MKLIFDRPLSIEVDHTACRLVLREKRGGQVISETEMSIATARAFLDDIRRHLAVLERITACGSPS